MEISTIISLGISLISIILCIATFVRNGNKDTKKETSDESYKWGQLDAQLQNMGKQIDKILDKLDVQDKEADEKIQKAIEQHIAAYHKGEK